MKQAIVLVVCIACLVFCVFTYATARERTEWMRAVLTVQMRGNDAALEVQSERFWMLRDNPQGFPNRDYHSCIEGEKP